MDLQDRVSFFAKTRLPTAHGTFDCYVFRGADRSEHVALVKGSIAGAQDVLCRVHSECLTGEVFGSLKCDCKNQLNLALEQIAIKKRGLVVYMRQEGRGIGLGNKIRAYALQEKGFDTVDANRELSLPDDNRTYGEAAAIIDHLKVRSIAIMTNNPQKISGLKAKGIAISRRVPLIVNISKQALTYLKSKKERMGHLIDFEAAA